MNRTLWCPPYRGSLPSFPCPACREGHLLSSADDLREAETGESKRAHGHEAWDPEWVDERFSTLFRCNNPNCGHVVGAAGTVSVRESPSTLPNGDWDMEYVPLFTPMAFWEAPPIIRPCAECPEDVAAQLSRSFPLYWLDRSACANAVRATVETMLTERGIPETTTNRQDKIVRISLHDRIEKFKAMNQAAADLLLAIKVLGNVGSHGDDVTVDDLLDAYEILDHVVDTVYSTRAERAARLASELTARLSSSP